MKNRIGIVGGGQLARMLIFDAKKMGFFVTVLDPTPQSPAGQVADQQIVADLSDKKAMEELAKNSDYMTIEWELADDVLLEKFAKKGIPVNPSPATLRIIKDKFVQKEFLKKHHIPVADFLPVIASEQEIKVLAKKFGYPFLLKAKMDAYDGRGNVLITKEADIKFALEKLKDRSLYAEKFVPFTKEISVIVARSMQGDIATYPVGENIHINNILHTTIVPARISQQINKKAESLAKKTMKVLKGAGVFGIEMFVTRSASSGQAKILINEIAPRVHNSGHYTIEGCITSQFEQHIRAVTGMPLGDTSLKAKTVVMVNILGERNGKVNVEGMEKALKIPGVSVHIYGKAYTKVDRKMGHITVVGKTVTDTLKYATEAKRLIRI